MKKEFKAPIVESKELSTLNTIMDGADVSGEMGKKFSITIDDAATRDDFKAWKGLN